jgi:chromosome segregation ATPase
VSLIDTAKKVKAGAKRLDWISDLAEALESVGSIEQAEKEGRSALKRTQEELSAAKDELDSLRSKIGDSEASIRASEKASSDASRSALEVAQSAIDKARAEALGIIESAEKQSAAIAAKASYEKSKSWGEVDRAKRELEDLEQKSAQVQRDIDNFLKEFEAAKEEAASVLRVVS